MRVENPRFDKDGLVCADCPFTNSEGCIDPAGTHYYQFAEMCLDWEVVHGTECPSSETYQTACLMAEEAAKGGKG